MDNNSFMWASLVKEMLGFVGGRTNTDDTDKLRMMVQEISRENRSSSAENELVKQVLQLLESNMTKQTVELQATVQERDQFKTQLQDLTFRVNQMMKNETPRQEPSPDSSLTPREKRLIQMFDELKRMRKREPYDQDFQRQPNFHGSIPSERGKHFNYQNQGNRSDQKPDFGAQNYQQSSQYVPKHEDKFLNNNFSQHKFYPQNDFQRGGRGSRQHHGYQNQGNRNAPMQGNQQFNQAKDMEPFARERQEHRPNFHQRGRGHVQNRGPFHHYGRAQKEDPGKSGGSSAHGLNLNDLSPQEIEAIKELLKQKEQEKKVPESSQESKPNETAIKKKKNPRKKKAKKETAAQQQGDDDDDDNEESDSDNKDVEKEVEKMKADTSVIASVIKMSPADDEQKGAKKKTNQKKDTVQKKETKNPPSEELSTTIQKKENTPQKKQTKKKQPSEEPSTTTQKKETKNPPSEELSTTIQKKENAPQKKETKKKQPSQEPSTTTQAIPALPTIQKLKLQPEDELNNLMLIVKEAGKTLTFEPKTIQQLLDIKRAYPNAQTVVLKSE